MIDVQSWNSPVDAAGTGCCRHRSYPAEVRLIGWRIGPGAFGEGGPQLCDLAGEVQVSPRYLHERQGPCVRGKRGPGPFVMSAPGAEPPEAPRCGGCADGVGLTSTASPTQDHQQRKSFVASTHLPPRGCCLVTKWLFEQVATAIRTGRF